jgi:hypothetical protein
MPSHTLPTTAPTRRHRLRDFGLLLGALALARLAPTFRRSTLSASNGSAS